MNNYLTSLAQWLPVLLAPGKNGKTTKIPVDHNTGMPCDAHAPAFWTTYERATAVAQAWGPTYGVGFVLTAADPFFCVDIDHALQPDGTWSPLAQQLVAGLPGCMVEVSQSGQGLHIWGRYPNPPKHRMKRVDLGVELYTELRFILLGTQQAGEIAERCDALLSLIAQVFPPIETGSTAVPDEGPRADWRGPADDEELLRRALRSTSMAATFGGNRATFFDLWTANVDVLARAYPADPSSSEPYDRSSADAALAAHLAFWTGCDVARIERLMRRSALAREKWDKAVSAGDVPELTDANIRSTFKMLHDSRGEIFERGVIACFKGLAWDYKTNLPQKFGRRIVMTYLTGSYGHSKCDQLDDLVRVLSVLDGKPEPDHRRGIYSAISAAGLNGWPCKAGVVETEYLSIRTFKNHNGHVTFKRPDLVDKMNLIIAKHYPGALPAPK